MGQADKGGPAVAAVQLWTLEQMERFYVQEYPRLVKILVTMGANLEEAEDAAQKAMTDFAHRRQAGKVPDRNPAAYVRKAAVNFFIKERQRDRERQTRELKGGHLTAEHFDGGLTDWEDEQHLQHLLEWLTPGQCQVITLLVEGLSTSEIAEALGKTSTNIRQQQKNGLDRLRRHPDIAPLAPRKLPDPNPARQNPRTAATTPAPRKGEVQ